MDRFNHDQLAHFADDSITEIPRCGRDSEETSVLSLDFNEWIHEIIRREASRLGKRVFGLTEAYALAIEGWGSLLGEEFLIECLRHSIRRLDGQTLEFTHLPISIQRQTLNQLTFVNA